MRQGKPVSRFRALKLVPGGGAAAGVRYHDVWRWAGVAAGGPEWWPAVKYQNEAGARARALKAAGLLDSAGRFIGRRGPSVSPG